MLGIFFLLVWITVIATLTSTEKRRAQRLLLPGEVDHDFQVALAQHDHGALIAYYRLALLRNPPALDEQLIRINLACALNGLKEHRQALEELDRVSLQHLSPMQSALWLNNRAYTLTLLGRSEDALTDLADAEDLLAGDEGRDPSLLACIAGTRGIALFRRGDYDRAEKALELALHLEDGGPALMTNAPVDLIPDGARMAERWWWLSEIAKAKGDLTSAQHRLLRAAAYPFTEFGSRAADMLRLRQRRHAQPLRPANEA